MLAREGVALGGNIVEIGIGSDRASEADLLMNHVRPETQDGVFDHRRPYADHHDHNAGPFGCALVITPVQEAQQQKHEGFLAEKGKPGENRDEGIGQAVLQPCHQVDFPGEGESVAGELHDV